MLTERQRRFLDHGRVGHLATADAKGAPHLIPVCYAVEGDTLTGYAQRDMPGFTGR